MISKLAVIGEAVRICCCLVMYASFELVAKDGRYHSVYTRNWRRLP